MAAAGGVVVTAAPPPHVFHGTALQMNDLLTAGELAGSSFVLRKLAIVLEEPHFQAAAEVYASWPRSLREFQLWLEAADFLLAEPPLAYLAFLFGMAVQDHARCYGAVLLADDDPMTALAKQVTGIHTAPQSLVADGYTPATAATTREAWPAACSETSKADLPVQDWLVCCAQVARLFAGVVAPSHLFIHSFA